MSNSIPRGRRVEATATAQSEAKRFEAVICGKCVLTAAETEQITQFREAVPTVFRDCVAGDVVVLATDASGNYTTPRLRKDASFKENAVFSATPNFTLVDVLTKMTTEDGSIDSAKATSFAASLREKYIAARKNSKAALLAALTAKPTA